MVPPVTTAIAPAPSLPHEPRFDYPVARRTADADVMFGVGIADPYRWLETDSEETNAWFTAEDQRARREIAKLPDAPALIAGLKPLYANPLPRLAARRGTATFFRTGPKIARQNDGAHEFVFFDEVQHAGDGAIARWPLSRDGAHAVVVQSKNGADAQTAVVVDTQSGKSSDHLGGLENSDFVWAPETGGNRGFFYCFTPPGTPHAGRFGERTIRFHALGTSQEKDRVVVPADHDINASSGKNPIAVTKDGKRLLVQVGGNWAGGTFAVVDLGRPDWSLTPLSVADAVVVEDEIYGIIRYPETGADIVRIGQSPPTTTIVAHAVPGLLDLEVFGKWLSVKRAPPRGKPPAGFVLRDFHDAKWTATRTVTTPQGMQDFYFAPSPDAAKLIVSREGLGVPPHRVEFDPATGKETPLLDSKVEWPTSEFILESLDATSADGTAVPISVLRRRDTPVDGTAALALYGYGGFRNSAEAIFYPPWMIWPQKRGRIFAQCHMRGGVEFGPDWHTDGAVRNRQRTLDDFHACLETLHAKGYSTPGRTVIQGWSHGGMMVTAAALQRPDLQRVVVAQAPLEDMIRYVHFGRGGITEYGDPENEGDFRALLGFSPYQHVKTGVAYPAFFVTAPSKDERVHPMHPRKIVAALQHASNATPGSGEVLLKVLWDAGHHGGAKDDANEVMAEAWAFALSKFDPPAAH